MKKFIAIIFSIILFGQTSFAKDLSSWAESDFIKLSSKGILTIDTVTGDLSQNITRGEFCKLVTNVYCVENTVTLKEDELGVFSDTDDEYILKAYKLGIVSGKGEKSFCPDEPITRQEMAVMLSRLLKKVSDSYSVYTNQVTNYNRKYTDSNTTDSWALSDMAAINSYGIINGNDKNMAEPKSFATREQAICMLNRLYNMFITEAPVTYQYPKLTRFNDLHITTHKISLEWSYTPNVEKYTVIVKQNGKDSVMYDTTPTNRSLLSFDTGFDGEDEITVYIGAKLINGVWLFSAPVSNLNASEPVEENKESTNDDVTPVENSQSIQNNTENTQDNQTSTPRPQANSTDADTQQNTANEEVNTNTENTTAVPAQNLNEKEARIFPCGYYFQTEEEAASYMVEVTVPVWHLTESGEKVSSQKYITVNQALADDVVSIFTEIYNDPSQFPIKNVGGYSWRNTSGGRISQHSYGSCIDINWEENYYVEPDGTPITGTHWKPGEDPYSIAEDSIVVTTFAKYGWAWGGNAWSEKYAKDYMHFTYLGK